LGKLPPEEKVLIAISLTDFALEVCAAGIRVQNPKISDAELLERLKERLEWLKSQRQQQQLKRGV
jgi:hypothetical protein